jgi:REP element-mobilizing transposase RayT
MSAMLIQPYLASELSFAWCYRVYFRWRTHRRQPNSHLRKFTAEVLDDLIRPYGIHLLELATDPIDLRALVSLTPHESVSAAASKTKGRVSKWLTEQAASESTKQLARGYFAVTTRAAATDEINAYLDRQGEHHGYADRARPPLFVRAFPMTPAAESALQADHAVTRLRFHIVLATWWRRGVFGDASGEAVAERWRELQTDLRLHVDKVSFVPDHVHLAVTLHPTVDLASAVVALMNAGQEIMWNRFDHDVIRAGVERLWQPSAYIGSFGELTSNAISVYIARWDRDAAE